MTNEGFSALLILLFAGAAGLLLPRRVDADAWQHRSRRARLWRYQLSCWASLLVAVGFVLWLWAFEPAPVDDDVLLRFLCTVASYANGIASKEKFCGR